MRAAVRSLPEDAVVVAGPTGLSRLVRGAKLATEPLLTEHGGPNELLVTNAGSIVDNEVEWDRLIHDLDDAHVAGVAIRLATDERLPAGLIDAADRHAVPLITFPATVELDGALGAVVAALLNAHEQRLDRVLDIHQRFNSIVLDGGGEIEIATTLHSLLDCGIAVIDRAGRPTTVVPADAADGTDLATVPAARQSIALGEQEYGEIVALTGAGELDDDRRLALQRAALAIAVRLAHASAVAAEQERFAARSLEELIAGTPGEIADVVERASSFGWNLTKSRAVLLASVDPWTDPEHLGTSLGTIAFAARATLGRDAIVWTRSTSVAALVAPDSSDPAERRRIADRLREELNQRVTLVTVSIGVGRCVDDPLHLQHSYVEASRAVDVGRWAKGRHVTEVYDELGLERLLASTPADDLAEFVEQAIGQLVEHDRSHDTELVETLGMWLETHNMAEAARRLHVHYNTLKNRLDRIESIVGPVLTDSARALECSVAVYVYRHYDGPWASA